MLNRQQIQETRFVLAFDKHASTLKKEAHEFAKFLKNMPIKSEYAKQLVIELESLVEAKGIEIKKPLSHIAFLIEQLQPFQTNKEVWFTSINQEQLKTVQQHLININLAIINALHEISQIDIK